jgi:TRAP-type C4-dicarboxylate transport system permease small subunit
MMQAVNMSKAYVYLAVPISGVFFVLFGIESLAETILGKED